MLRWALIFFVVSLVAAFFGFSGISAATAGIAKILFAITVVIAVGLVVGGLVAGNKLLKS